MEAPSTAAPAVTLRSAISSSRRKLVMSRPRKTYQHPGSHMHGWPVTRRLDSFSYLLLEIMCPHGIGHPMPESVEHLNNIGPKSVRGTWGVHGCDGCCLGRNETINAHD